MVKKIINLLNSSNIFRELDNFISYLYVVNRNTKDRNLSHRILKIIKLINQIKDASITLNKELIRLRSDMLFEQDFKRRR